MMKDTISEGRRAFLLTLLRGVVFTGVLAGIGALVVKQGETCIGSGICRGCAELSQCGLPQALSLKEASSRKR